MKLVQTADGMVSVYELDPTKHYVLFIDPLMHGAAGGHEISIEHGALNWVRNPAESVVIVEEPGGNHRCAVPRQVLMPLHNQPDRDAFTREDRRLLNRILDVLLILTRQGVEMAIDLANLEAAVERNTTVDGSVAALVDLLVAQVAELKAGADPAMQARIDVLVAKLTADHDRLAEKVTANTPQA